MLAIQAENISKQYIIKHQNAKRPTTFKEALKSIFTGKQEANTQEEFWALQGVNFEVNVGDRLGIIGANGAGKSTLLKILSRITEPTTGRVKINGRVASLLEVGTGFHQELSGRENIYLNGAILGMSKTEISRKFDEIVAFSGVEKFLDTPVKRYSSGMYVRLGFSIAAHLEPDILIVDEVLAVGDSEFQKKCLGKMKEVSSHGRTILFVSHNLTAVESLCNKALFLKNGQVNDQGMVKPVVNTYLSNYSKNRWIEKFEPNHPLNNEFVRLHKIEIQPKFLPNQSIIDVRTPIDIRIDFENLVDFEKVNISLFVHSLTGELVFNTASKVIAGPKAKYSAVCQIPAPLLNDGSYTISFLIVKDTTAVMLTAEEILQFEMADWRNQEGEWYGKWPGIIRPNIEFDLSQTN